MSLSRPDNSNARERPIHDEHSSASDEPGRDVPGSVEFSAPLESVTSLEAPKPVRVAPTDVSVSQPSSASTAPIAPTNVQTDQQIDHSVLQTPALSQPESPLELEPLVPGVVSLPSEARIRTQNLSASTVSIETIPLLEERLVVDRQKRKIGEVIMRKEIETYIVEVPVRREKLIVEQISPEYKQLAVVDLGQQGIESSAVEAADATFPLTVKGEFGSAEAARQFLEALSAHSVSAVQMVQVSVVFKDAQSQAFYQHWLEQYSAKIVP